MDFRLASRSLASLAALCASLTVSSALAAKRPNVHFVLDRSGSMSTSVPGAGPAQPAGAWPKMPSTRCSTSGTVSSRSACRSFHPRAAAAAVRIW